MKKTLTYIITVICCMCAFVCYVGAADCTHNWSVYSVSGSACETHYVTYQCSKCYSYKTENAQPTEAHKWQVAYKEETTCTKNGFTSYVCSVCFSLKTEEGKASGHEYTYIYNDDATCTKDGTKIGTCKKCGFMDIFTNEGSAKGHTYSGDWEVIRASTCLSEGVSKRDCIVCNVDEIRYDALGPHTDKNKDYKCDVCKTDLSPGQNTGSDDDSVQDDNIIKDCSCKCHKGGITGFFWKIGNFFAKLFKIKSKQICACGIYHF